MKKGLIILIIVLVVGVWIFGSYNGLVQLREETRTAWANVETQYQRRADLVPQLVSTVQGAADFEQSTLTAVTEARASASQTNVDISDAQSLAAYQASQGELSSALSRLLVTVESYPDIKANENFLSLQSQLEGTENRISVARTDYNTVAQRYRVRIKSLPTVLYAGLLGFDEVALFEAAEGSSEAPEIDFSFDAE